jgi:hypothetical protein
MYHEDALLAFLATSLTNRSLFRLEWRKNALNTNEIDELHRYLAAYLPANIESSQVVLSGLQEIKTYDPDHEEILIAYKDGKVDAIENCADVHLYTLKHSRYFVAYPKFSETF